MTCKRCKFFEPFKKVAVPPEPEETRINIFGFEVDRDYREVLLEESRRLQAIEINKSGLCTWHPEHVEKHENSYCGQFEEIQ